jgi:hypothetical protein
MKKPLFLFGLFLLLGFFVYTLSYAVLSRQGFREADEMHCVGFYSVFPNTDEEKAQNDFCNFIFYPLVQIDLALGTGRRPGCDPLMGFE